LRSLLNCRASGFVQSRCAFQPIVITDSRPS
jgi:hypothetical protein